MRWCLLSPEGRAGPRKHSSSVLSSCLSSDFSRNGQFGQAGELLLPGAVPGPRQAQRRTSRLKPCQAQADKQSLLSSCLSLTASSAAVRDAAASAPASRPRKDFRSRSRTSENEHKVEEKGIRATGLYTGRGQQTVSPDGTSV